MTTAVAADPFLRPAALEPPAPLTLAETGLTRDALEQLLVKALYIGELSGSQLADHLCLAYSLLEDILQHARVDYLGR